MLLKIRAYLDNRLMRVDLPDGDYVEYVYDPFGKRMRKSVFGSLPSDGYYQYDNEDIIVEYASNGTVAAHYLHGQGIDEPISMTRGGNTYYYTMDGLGSVVELTDSSSTVVESYEYDNFGNTSIYDSSLVLHSSSVVGNSYGFTGREYDAETGLYFYRARYYDVSIGRFISQDPIGFSGGVNFYTYVANNPLNSVDSYGLFAVVPPGYGVFWGDGIRDIVPEFPPGDWWKDQAEEGECKKKDDGKELKCSHLATGIKNLNKGIRSINKQIQKHLEKIAKCLNNPTPECVRQIPEWEREISIRFPNAIQKLQNDIENLRNQMRKLGCSNIP